MVLGRLDSAAVDPLGIPVGTISTLGRLVDTTDEKQSNKGRVRVG